jgi:hypothetical protein
MRKSSSIINGELRRMFEEVVVPNYPYIRPRRMGKTVKNIRIASLLPIGLFETLTLQIQNREGMPTAPLRSVFDASG